MNGQSAFGWLKVAAVLAVILALGLLAFFGARKLREWFTRAEKAIAETIGPNGSAHNPISNTVDKGVAAVTGGNSLGTWLAEIFDPATREADAAIKRATMPPAIPQREAKPVDNPPIIYEEDSPFAHGA